MSLLKQRPPRPVWLAALLLVPTLASAHPGIIGHDSALAAGLLHPLLGLDHLLAMLAVGLWAAQQGGRASWLLPAGFVGGMIGGAALGMQGMALSLAEPGIAGSLLVLGLVIAAGRRIPLAASVGVTMLFGLCHGHAHGTELPAAAAPLWFGAGFLLSTSLLHAAGVGIGRSLLRQALPMLLRLIGAGVAMSGAVLLAVA